MTAPAGAAGASVGGAPGPSRAASAGRRAEGLRAALFAGLLLAAVLPRIDQPGEYVFDEVYQAFTAARYAAGDADAYLWNTKARGPSKYCAYEWIHPPLAKLLLAASVRTLGDRPVAWRLPCALAGAALVAGAYLLARRVVPARGAAELAALALVADGLVLVMSRTGMSDVFVALFVMLGYGAFFRWLGARRPETTGTVPDARGERRALWAMGLFFGLGIATKWFALLGWGFTGLVVGGDALGRAWRARAAGPRVALSPLGRVAAALVLLPAALYLASYLPFFASGRSLADLRELVRQQVYYHAHLTARHDYASAWWGWPLQLRSVWLWTGTRDGVHRDVYLFGNPALWWPAVAGVLVLAAGALRSWLRRRRPSPAATVILLAFLGQWLPFALPARPAFVYYILSAAPFAAMAAAWLVTEAARRLPGRLGAGLPWLCAGVVVGVAAWLYPLWTGLPLSDAAWRARFLLSGWR